MWAWRSRPLEEPLYGCSPLEPRVRVDLIDQDYESEVSEILLMVDPRGIVESGVGARYGHSPLLVSVD